MKKKLDKSRKLTAALLIIIISLASIGAVLYFTVYTPYFDAERTRLLTFTTDLAPVDLDPAWALDTDSYNIALNVFDRLVQYKEGTTEIEPNIATSWETPDPRTYIFTLRDDVMFHDGTQLNATSVKFSLERALDMGSYIFSIIENIEILDTYKLKITLYDEFTPFIQILAHPAASIVSQTAVEKMGDEEFDYNPVGSGPFKFESWDDELVLVSNEDYFKGPPNFKKLVFNPVLESSQRLTLLNNGEYDAVLGSTGLQLSDIETFEDDPDIQVTKEPGLFVEYLGFNLQNEILSDIRVREAISYAIDYDTIINDVLAGVAKRNYGPIPPGILGHVDLPLIQRDANKARQLLSDAGYPQGFEITLTYNIDNLDRRQTAEVIRDSLEDIGINVRLQGLDWDSALDAYLSLEYQMCLNTWQPDYLDPDSFLSPQFHTLSLAPDGANIFAFSDTEVDNLIDQAAITLSPEVRQNLYQQAQEEIVNQIPAVFLYVPELYNLVRFDIGNWIQSPTGYFYAENLYRR